VCKLLPIFFQIFFEKKIPPEIYFRRGHPKNRLRLYANSADSFGKPTEQWADSNFKKKGRTVSNLKKNRGRTIATGGGKMAEGFRGITICCCGKRLSSHKSRSNAAPANTRQLVI
jgi:hypothetical protein